MKQDKDVFVFDIHDDEDAIVHRHQNAELLFYQQVAKGDVDAIRENCLNHEFLNQAGVGMLSKDPLQNLSFCSFCCHHLTPLC